MIEEIPARPPDGHRVVCGECGKHHFNTNPPDVERDRICVGPSVDDLADVIDVTCRECSSTLFRFEAAEVES